MGDFAELLIFLAVVVISLLAGGKKRDKRQPPRRPAGRPPQARPVRRATMPTPTPQGPAGLPTRDSLAREILQLLGGEVPAEHVAAPPPPQRPEPDVVALDDYRREAVSLEAAPREARALDAVDLSRKREHEEFHERYMEAHPTAGRKRASRYHRVTPRTAREAVIWKTIFSPPKALE